jgi:hypothetical protein
MKHTLIVKAMNLFSLYLHPNTESCPSQASHTIERDAVDLPTGNLLPVAGAHVHNGKKIEEGFPSGGYGMSSLLRTSLCADTLALKTTSTCSRNPPCPIKGSTCLTLQELP